MNIAEKAVELIKQLGKEGFNGVGVDFYEYESVWNKHYAIFIMAFDTYNDGDYISFDRDLFDSDLMRCLEKLFPKCKINYQGSCDEIEIIGPDYDKWYKKNADRLEKFENDNWEENKKLRKKGPVIFE